MKHHITSFFGRRFERDTTYKVDRANSSYSYFISEYRGGIAKDEAGNVLISEKKERLKRIKRHIGIVINKQADSYTYFVNEYRQNSPTRDPYGNIILFDEIEPTVRRH